MKVSRGFIVFIVVAVILAIVVQMQMPKRYSWRATFSPIDANPFGCMLMDSVLHASLPHGYRVKTSTLWQLRKGNENLLYVGERAIVDSATLAQLEDVARQGRKVMLVVSRIDFDGDSLAARLGVTVKGYLSFNLQDLQREVGSHDNIMDTVKWLGTAARTAKSPASAATGDDAATYKALYQLVTFPVTDVDTTRWQTLVSNRMAVSDDRVGLADTTERAEWRAMPQAVRRRIGRGELYVVSTPLLFTNYGMLEGETSGLVFRLMDCIADRPVIRIADQEDSEKAQELMTSPFRALFRVKALTWAFYAMLATVLLFFVFTARRRQRAMPVVRPPQNHTLEFTRLIGTLFYQRHDHRGLVRRRWELFAANLRRQAGVDVQSLDDDDALFTQLAARTGMDYEDIARTIKGLRLMVLDESGLSARQMKEAIDQMDEIEEKTR